MGSRAEGRGSRRGSPGPQRTLPSVRPGPAQPGPGHAGRAVLRCDASSALSLERLLWPPTRRPPCRRCGLSCPWTSPRRAPEGARGIRGNTASATSSPFAALISMVCFVISAFLTGARNALCVPKEVSSLPGGVYQYWLSGSQGGTLVSALGPAAALTQALETHAASAH